MARPIGVAFTSVFLSACPTRPPVEDNDVIGHVISIGRDGELEELYPGNEMVLNPGDESIEKYKRSGRWENTERVLHMLPPDAHKQIHFKIFGLRDEAERLQEHGSFGVFEFWTNENCWDKHCLPT